MLLSDWKNSAINRTIWRPTTHLSAAYAPNSRRLTSSCRPDGISGIKRNESWASIPWNRASPTSASWSK
eukprot:5755972-Lingulodinium_polyedra.AAC.1